MKTNLLSRSFAKMASVAYVPWDSEFFGRKIGRYTLQTDPETARFSELLTDAKRQQYNMVYVFAPEHTQLPPDVSRHYQCLLADTRLVYTRQIDASLMYENDRMHEFTADDDLLTMHELAYASGEYSRYRTDPHFTDDDYRRLYREWMDNSLNGTLADQVFVYKTQEQILGMITVKIADGVGTVGLLATDPAHQGEGVGRACFQYTLNSLREKQVPRLNVATQQANIPACRFYERMNCQVASRTDIYHVWL